MRIAPLTSMVASTLTTSASVMPVSISAAARISDSAHSTGMVVECPFIILDTSSNISSVVGRSRATDMPSRARPDQTGLSARRMIVPWYSSAMRTIWPKCRAVGVSESR